MREKVKEAPLPEGIFYDGRGYIDGFGDWTADHPALEAAVEAEMRALNAEAERCNAALATQHAAAQAEAAAYLGCVQGSIEVDGGLTEGELPAINGEWFGLGAHAEGREGAVSRL